MRVDGGWEQQNEGDGGEGDGGGGELLWEGDPLGGVCRGGQRKKQDDRRMGGIVVRRVYVEGPG